MDYSLYVHVNKINGKRYVGITCKDPEYRWGVNGSKYKSSPHFYSAIKKYGWNNFEHIILITGLSKDQACALEKRLIRKWKTQNKEYGYNISDGGDKGPTLFGKDNPNFGKERSEEYRRHISESHMGHPVSDETKIKLRENNGNNKSIICVETGNRFASISEAARSVNVSAAAICRVLHGGRHTSGGFHWEYAA